MRTAVILFLVMFVSAAVYLRQEDPYARFMESAEKTNALVVKKEERTVGDDKKKEYWVVYRYRSKGGYSHTSREYVEYADIWQRLRQGQATEVYFNPKKPSESHLALSLERRLGVAQKADRRELAGR